MQITEEWLESIKDDKGLTNGQKIIMDEWARRLAFVGYGHLPDQAARFLLKCRGYRCMPPEARNRLNGL